MGIRSLGKWRVLSTFQAKLTLLDPARANWIGIDYKFMLS
jgi:hypothetical protein